MKLKHLAILVLFMAFIACSEQEYTKGQGTASNVTFEQLSVEVVDSTGSVVQKHNTRATMNNNKVTWDQGDKFVLNYGDKSAIFSYTPTGYATTDLIKRSDKYYAYYSADNVKKFNDNNYTVTIPNVQTVANGNVTSTSLQYAAVTSTSKTIQFKMVCGVLDLQLKDLNTTIDKVEVTSTSDITGEALVNPEAITSEVKGSKNLTINGNISATSAHCGIVLPTGSRILIIKLWSGSECITRKVNVNIKRATLTKVELNAKFPSKVVDENIIILNEGSWQSDNGQVSFIHNHRITNNWFASINGTKIGDTPQDVLYIPSKNMVVISVNWSNIVYFINTDGRIIAQTENIPNCRALATDGDYVYITSYAHEAADGNTYEGGYVAKIDLNTFQVVQTYGVGYEPEGIAYYNGKVYVANTGGYAFQESHSYEHTVSVIDVITGNVETVDITDSDGSPVINLYGEMSQVGPYLCINSPGDYTSISPATVIFDCRDNSYEVKREVPCTYNTVTSEGKFLTIGSYFSYNTGAYQYNIATIDPVTKESQEGFVVNNKEVESFRSTIESMQNPYCVYINPYTNHCYATDAASYASSGVVYEWDDKGNLVGEPLNCYINPGHMCAIDHTPQSVETRAFNKKPIVLKQIKHLNENRHLSINDYYRNRR